jgi:RHS repeat-associated protein
LRCFAYNLRFPGQIFDGQAGLHANGYRDYDPATGRYPESDPIGLWGGSYSTYAYANGNPIGKIDPLGLAPPGRTAPGVQIPIPLPPIVIPGSPENRAWANSALQQIDETLRKAAQAIYNACTSNSEDARCKKVYTDCANQWRRHVCR